MVLIIGNRKMTNNATVKPRPLGRAGFSLIEIAIVVLIIGLVLGIAVPSFRGFTERARVDGTLEELVMDIQYARSLAVSKNRSYQIQFAGNSYQIIDMVSGAVLRDKAMPDRVGLAASGNPQFRSFGRTDPVNITVTGTHSFRTISVMSTGNIRYQ
jgi:prepilin-type N-terminal cleavage/methylation domain-containing protein